MININITKKQGIITNFIIIIEKILSKFENIMINLIILHKK